MPAAAIGRQYSRRARIPGFGKGRLTGLPPLSGPLIVSGLEIMRPTLHPATSTLPREEDLIVEDDRDDILDSDADRLPIQVAAPVIIGLSLALWTGIGFAISALL